MYIETDSEKIENDTAFRRETAAPRLHVVVYTQKRDVSIVTIILFPTVRYARDVEVLI